MGKILNSMISGRFNNRKVEEIIYNNEIIWSSSFDKYAISYTVDSSTEYLLNSIDPETNAYYALPKFTLGDGTEIVPGVDSRYSVDITLKNGRVTSDINTPLSGINKIEINYTADVSAIIFSDNKEITSIIIGLIDNLNNVNSMFKNCSKLRSIDLSRLNTTNLTDMRYMFSGCTSLTSLDLSTFDTSKVTNMSYMFNGCSSLTSLDLSNWNTNKVTTSIKMFSNVPDINGWTYDFYSYEKINLKEYYTDYKYTFPWNYGLVYTLDKTKDLTFESATLRLSDRVYVPVFKPMTSFSGSNGTSKLVLNDGKIVGASNISVSNIKYVLFKPTNPDMIDLENTRIEKILKHNVSGITRLYFSKCTTLVSADLSQTNTSKITSMSMMFDQCTSLTSLNLSGWNVKNVTDMSMMFDDCTSLTSLNLSGWNTENVTNMTLMFYNCKSLTSLDLSNFNTSKVTNMTCMFKSCFALSSLNLSGWNTENVTNMFGMFEFCSALTSLDLTSFNTSNVTNMSYMFSICRALTTLDLSNFNTINVTDMSSMFSSCNSLTSLNLSNFNTSNVTDMKMMFQSCFALTSLDLTSFNTSNVTSNIRMFDGVVADVYVSDNYFTLTPDSGFRGNIIRI